MNSYPWDIWRWLNRMTPGALRRWVNLRWFWVHLAPVRTLYAAFLDFVGAQRYEQQIDGTVWQLERVLNDVFDFGLRRIYITDTDRDLVQFWKDGEGPDVQMWKQGEGPLLSMWTTAEASAEFIVHIPAQVWASVAIIWPGGIRSYILRYKTAGPTYRIKLF